MINKSRSQGFSMVEATVTVLIVAVLGLGGWYVWNKNHKKDDTKASNHTSQNQNNHTDGGMQPDIYSGWKVYDNAAYGIGFRYPAEWTLNEGSSDATDSSTKQEYAINLKRNEDVKYNETATIEILGEDLGAATAWYDNYFAQSTSNKVVKTTNQLKSKQSVQYVITNAGVETRLYLFQVDGKTYVLRSVNEELNVQVDANYWAIFDKVFESIQVK